MTPHPYSASCFCAACSRHDGQELICFEYRCPRCRHTALRPRPAARADDPVSCLRCEVERGTAVPMERKVSRGRT